MMRSLFDNPAFYTEETFCEYYVCKPKVIGLRSLLA